MTAEGIVGQYLALKAETDADVLAMQMGDFYEFFHEDAELVGRELDLKVSERSSGGEAYKMAGVPLDDLTPYLSALVERGYRVAVADQYETDDGHARRIERVVTPGTLLETSDADARYLASVVAGDGSDEYGLAFVDVTTGRFHVTAVADRAAVLTELYRFAPTEIVPGPAVRTDDELLNTVRERTEATLTLHATDAFAPGRARHTLREQFGDVEDALALDSTLAVQAAGGALDYLAETGTGALASVTRLGTYTPDDHVAVDATTQRNLELTETMTGAGRSLFETVDHTETSAGRRLLKQWLGRPRRARGELERRQACVGAFCEAALAREELRETLADAYDLERLASRTVSGSADAHGLLRVKETLALLDPLGDLLDSTPRLADSPVADVLDGVDREAAADLHATLDESLAEDPPNTVTQGGLLRPAYDEELADLVARHEACLEWFDTLADRESEATGIARLSVDRNKTDGYYIQVAKSQADAVPERYEGIKTLKNSQRYVTDELREREREVLRLEERRGELEYELFGELRDEVAAHAELLQDVGRVLAELDTLASLATHAVRNDWTRPDLVESGPLHVEAGRHPVVETDVNFVPNDLHLDAERRFLIVTGPNMSGKSTYMRQAALVTLLAQVGSFVPARAATVGVVDGIYTRVGALDELAQGRSTFMVEMQELSNILHSATDESLVILDEVGRGTATYDGISIAWAATEYLHNTVGAKTLFATHYHELTGLAEHLPRVANVHVSVDESDGDVTFLRTVEEGATNRSYGVHVADLAGVPGPVVERAGDVLDRLREEKAIEAKGAESGAGEPVQAVFDLGSGSFQGPASADGGRETAENDPAPALDPETEAVLSELRGMDLTATSPIDLVSAVQEWQRRLDDHD
ncbi:DNA mismatch repair protein MutS [Halomarina oriensis]|uniref:DNA mismatch repair protein MutS n=1 Tax=Halomarina oriensis TaxID=671145 RepID=A0A6B0GDY8_9EURY|nr:DNA mismatch repair protein MutS [Halomarina oriensis]MWG32904.1 DNA mismatch repair protein MutS [Halomarina oriensis]